MNLLQTLSHCVCAVFWHINRTFTSTFVARNLSVVRTPNLSIETCYGVMFLTRNSATADGPRDALSVKILSSVETSCTTDKYSTNRMELEGYSWSTCSKQPRLVDCRIGVVNKLDRRRRRRRVVDNAIDLPRRNFLVRSLGQISRGMYPNFWRYPNFLITQCRIGERKPPWQIPSGFVQAFR